MSRPPHKRKVPYWKFSRDGSESAAFSSCPQEAQPYPNETRIEVLTCAVALPAQNFGWAKMLDFRRAAVFCLR